MRFAPQQLLCCSCVVAAGCITVFAIVTDDLAVVQVISGVYGLSIASMFSAAMTSCQEYVVSLQAVCR
jgi:hypothetical protein